MGNEENQMALRYHYLIKNFLGKRKSEVELIKCVSYLTHISIELRNKNYHLKKSMKKWEDYEISLYNSVRDFLVNRIVSRTEVGNSKWKKITFVLNSLLGDKKFKFRRITPRGLNSSDRFYLSDECVEITKKMLTEMIENKKKYKRVEGEKGLNTGQADKHSGRKVGEADLTDREKSNKNLVDLFSNEGNLRFGGFKEPFKGPKLIDVKSIVSNKVRDPLKGLLEQGFYDKIEEISSTPHTPEEAANIFRKEVDVVLNRVKDFNEKQEKESKEVLNLNNEIVSIVNEIKTDMALGNKGKEEQYNLLKENSLNILNYLNKKILDPKLRPLDLRFHKKDIIKTERKIKLLEENKSLIFNELEVKKPKQESDKGIATSSRTPSIMAAKQDLKKLEKTAEEIEEAIKEVKGTWIRVHLRSPLRIYKKGPEGSKVDEYNFLDKNYFEVFNEIKETIHSEEFYNDFTQSFVSRLNNKLLVLKNNDPKELNRDLKEKKIVKNKSRNKKKSKGSYKCKLRNLNFHRLKASLQMKNGGDFFERPDSIKEVMESAKLFTNNMSNSECRELSTKIADGIVEKIREKMRVKEGSVIGSTLRCKDVSRLLYRLKSWVIRKLTLYKNICMIDSRIKEDL